MYFRLNPECYLVMGRKHGAIYDLVGEDIYVLDPNECELLNLCDQNNPHPDNPECKQFLAELKKLRLGNFYQNEVYIQKLRYGSSLAQMQKRSSPPELSRAFLEINNLCNRDCWYCGYYGAKRSMGCMGCNKWRSNDLPLTPKRWKELIDQLKDLCCQNIFITGGDLTLAWDKTIDIVNYAMGKFGNVYVILPSQSLSDGVIADLTNKVKLILSVDNYKDIMSQDFIYHLNITPEAWKNIVNPLGKNVMLDFLIKDINSEIKDLPDKMWTNSPDIYRFFNNKTYHPCLGHTLSISYNGDVLPCPVMRDYRLGNVKDQELYAVFEKAWKEIEKFWKLNLDNIEGCKDCELRYSCGDCRALEEKLTGRLEGKRSCRYNPFEGD